MGNNIKKCKTDVGFADGVFAVNDHLTDKTVGDTVGAEFIISDIGKIKGNFVFEILS